MLAQHSLKVFDKWKSNILKLVFVVCPADFVLVITQMVKVSVVDAKASIVSRQAVHLLPAR